MGKHQYCGIAAQEQTAVHPFGELPDLGASRTRLAEADRCRHS